MISERLFAISIVSLQLGSQSAYDKMLGMCLHLDTQQETAYTRRITFLSGNLVHI